MASVIRPRTAIAIAGAGTTPAVLAGFGWHLHRVFKSKARLMSNQNIRSNSRCCPINPPIQPAACSLQSWTTGEVAAVRGFLDFVVSLIGSIILTLNCRRQRLDLYFNPHMSRVRTPLVQHYSPPSPRCMARLAPIRLQLFVYSFSLLAGVWKCLDSETPGNNARHKTFSSQFGPIRKWGIISYIYGYLE